MTTRIAISADQVMRPQPGGIGTYVRGLVGALADRGDCEVATVGPRHSVALDPRCAHHCARWPLAVVTRTWPVYPSGVPRQSDVVHATSLAGPTSGGRPGAIHTVALHDLLWRDEPAASTPAGRAFHESRLREVIDNQDLRIIVSSPLLPPRLQDLGVEENRIFYAPLGSDDATTPAAHDVVRQLLADHGVEGPYMLYAGTREPRKNVERLIEAHRVAATTSPEIGPLVIVGPPGWGHVDVGDAVALGLVDRAVLLGLYRDAALCAYVPLAEGWGLPPLEALRMGTRVVASSTCPSVEKNAEAILVDPNSLDSIVDGLYRATQSSDDESDKSRRRASVSDVTWARCAAAHLEAWR